MKLTKAFADFFNSEKAGGFILLGCTIISLLLANSSFQQEYSHIWHLPVAGQSLEYWINDGLMSIFFLLIGLELEREIYKGELSSFRNALLPISAAVGGMLVPAAIFILLNFGLDSQSGAGIPMATDIAFAIGMLSLLGNRVPAALKVFLTALAVIDDLGAILIIAFFYSKGIVLLNLGIAVGIFVLLIILNRLKFSILWVYLLGGVGMWWFMLHSGVHPTITGVMLAFAIPFGDGSERSISYRLQSFLHKPVAFIILPLFALANTAIIIPNNWMEGLGTMAGLGIILGLVIGKPTGILLFSWLAVKLRISKLPVGVNWIHVLGAGLLAGIGFTMSIFITLLAFDDTESITISKISILVASLLAALLGLVILIISLQRKNEKNQSA